MRKCSICENKHFANGLCGVHYRKKIWAENKNELTKKYNEYKVKNKDKINEKRNQRRKLKVEELKNQLMLSGKLRTTGECRECGVSISKNKRHCIECKIKIKSSNWKTYTEKNRDRKKTYEYKYSQKKKQAESRDIPWILKYEDFVTIMSGSCYYCGSSNNVGIDRINSFEPYEINNCAPCCKTCNQIKNQNLDEMETLYIAMSLKEFRDNRKPELTKTGCVKIPVKMFDDSRGFFTETYSNKLLSIIKQNSSPDQINCSSSYYDVIRGMHYNPINPQSKLVRVISGEIVDCVIDLRQGSETFGQIECFYLSNRNYALYIPKGFAHGFWSKEEDTLVTYSCWGLYDPDNDMGINPLDKTISFPWLRHNKTADYKISDKDLLWGNFDKNINVVQNERSEFIDDI